MKVHIFRINRNSCAKASAKAQRHNKFSHKFFILFFFFLDPSTSLRINFKKQKVKAKDQPPFAPLDLRRMAVRSLSPKPTALTPWRDQRMID
jgi:hypothetical protein